MIVGPWYGKLHHWTRRYVQDDGSPGPVAARLRRTCEGYAVQVGKERLVVPHGPHITARAKAAAEALLATEAPRG